MKKLPWLGKRNVGLDEVMWICLHQRRYDTNGNPLPRYTYEELLAMSEQQREAVKADGFLKLPPLITPHPPLKYTKDREENCACDGCVAALREWRERTGRV